MKKSLITLIALFLVFAFVACDILDLPLSAPIEDEITDSSTSPESSKETEQSETELKTEIKTEAQTEAETYADGSHISCEYCGKLDGDGRWFIAKVTENLMVMPIGTDCFEAKAAMGAGITLHYNEVDGEARRLTAGEYILVKYNGMIMESYPVQIGADKVSTVDGELYGESVPVDPSIDCNHNWNQSPTVDYKFTCLYCNGVHLCTDPKDWVRDGNLNESTAIYRCTICGTQHLTTDPDSIGKEEPTDEPTTDIIETTPAETTTKPSETEVIETETFETDVIETTPVETATKPSETEVIETETIEAVTKVEEETYPNGSHLECAFCGQLDGGGRWFIARVTEDLMVMPLGENCFEAKAAGDAGITLWYKEVDGEERRLDAGEHIMVYYNGMIMESYPVKIAADEVFTVDVDYPVPPELKPCDMCGYDEKGNRFFTAIFKDDMAYPMCDGPDCYEATAVRSSEVGIYVSFDEVDGDPNKKVKNGDIVIITYDGLIMESSPFQMIAYSGVIIGYQEPEGEQKKITDFLVDYGNFAVNMGDLEFFPIYGFVYSETYEYDSQLGEMVGICADGAGVSWYLEAIQSGEISDGDMPYITFNEDIYVNLNANQTLSAYYINVATKEENNIELTELYSLPYGDYYIILRVSTKKGRDSYGDEYIFKLAIRDNAPEIGDYIIVDMDTDRIYLEMPISKIKIRIDDDQVEWLNWINTALLIEADYHLTGGDSSFGGALWLTTDNFNIYLNSELIVDVPVEDEDATVAGCVGHEHVFDKYCIS